MKAAEDILFNSLIEGKPLFNSQFELVMDLLNNPKSSYYIKDKSSDDYKKETNRLKAYISQLLSNNINRNVTSAFKHSLEQVLIERLSLTKTNYKDVYNLLLKSLEDKNSTINIQSSQHLKQPKRTLFENIEGSKYILFITSRPIDFESEGAGQSIQKFLFKDLFETLFDKSKELKYHRFNFPLPQSCELFWLILKKLFDKTFIELNDLKNKIQVLHSRDIISKKTFSSISNKRSLDWNDINQLSNETLNYLNTNSYLLVFLITDPIYSVPMLITNPNESTNTNAYLILENDDGNMAVQKLGIADTMTWKFFFWDKLKTMNLGKPILFESCAFLTNLNKIK